MTFYFKGKKYKLNIRTFFSHVIMLIIMVACVAGLFFIMDDIYEKIEEDKSPAVDNYEVPDKHYDKDRASFTNAVLKKTTLIRERTKNMPVVSNSAIKRYEDRAAITCTTSKAYELCNVYGVAAGNGLVKYKDRYLVAMGQSYGQTGDKFNITLRKSDGKIHTLKVVLGDVKRDSDTVGGHGYHCADGHVIEGVVDTNCLPAQARSMGDLNYISEFNGEIVKIEKVVEN